MSNPSRRSSPVAAAQKHQSIRLLHESPEGHAGCQVAHMGGMYEAFGGCAGKSNTKQQARISEQRRH